MLPLRPASLNANTMDNHITMHEECMRTMGVFAPRRRQFLPPVAPADSTKAKDGVITIRDYEQIASLLEISADDMVERNHMTFATDVGPCPCGHVFGFSDMVRIALKRKVHAAKFMRPYFLKNTVMPPVKTFPFSGELDCPTCDRVYRGTSTYACKNYACTKS